MTYSTTMYRHLFLSFYSFFLPFFLLSRHVLNSSESFLFIICCQIDRAFSTADRMAFWHRPNLSKPAHKSSYFYHQIPHIAAALHFPHHPSPSPIRQRISWHFSGNLRLYFNSFPPFFLFSATHCLPFRIFRVLAFLSSSASSYLH